jgi:hypothetical protein
VDVYAPIVGPLGSVILYVAVDAVAVGVALAGTYILFRGIGMLVDFVRR